MKINIFSIVFIFSVLVSLSIQIQENQYYGKFLSKNNDQDVQLTLQSEEEEDQSKETDSTQEEETYEIPEDETEESQEEQKEQEEEKEEKEKEEKDKKDIPNTDQTPNTEEKDKVNITIQALSLDHFTSFSAVSAPKAISSSHETPFPLSSRHLITPYLSLKVPVISFVSAETFILSSRVLAFTTSPAAITAPDIAPHISPHLTPPPKPSATASD